MPTTSISLPPCSCSLTRRIPSSRKRVDVAKYQLPVSCVLRSVLISTDGTPCQLQTVQYITSVTGRPASHQKHDAAKDSCSSCSRISSVTYAAPTPPEICTKLLLPMQAKPVACGVAAAVCSCSLPSFHSWNNSSVSTNLHMYMRAHPPRPVRPYMIMCV